MAEKCTQLLLQLVVWIRSKITKIIQHQRNFTWEILYLIQTWISCFKQCQRKGCFYTHFGQFIFIWAKFLMFYKYFQGDFIQSLGVLVAAVLIKIFGWNVADPICTYIFSLVVMCTTIPVFKDIICVFLECKYFIRWFK